MREFKYTGERVDNGWFSKRISNMLIANGIDQIRGLCLHSVGELVDAVKGIGYCTAESIHDTLLPLGLALGMNANDLVENDGKCSGCHMLLRKGMRALHEKNCKHYNIAYKMSEENLGPPKPGDEGFSITNHKDQFVLACERDTDDPFRNSGPIAFEQMLGKAGILDVIIRAESFNGKYGKTMIFKLVPVGTPEECRSIIERYSP